MSYITERNCDKCIHHTRGNCDSWNCKMQTVEDVKNEVVNEYVKSVVEELEENASRYTKKYLTPYGNNGYRDTKAISIHKAIEIVKQGDVSGDACEWKKYLKYPCVWMVGCNLDLIASKQGDYCPYCGNKIKIVGD